MLLPNFNRVIVEYKETGEIKSTGELTIQEYRDWIDTVRYSNIRITGMTIKEVRDD